MDKKVPAKLFYWKISSDDVDHFLTLNME